MVITILSRDILVTYVTIWRFHISASDAASVMANHLGLKITTLYGDRYASLSYSPYTELYFGGTSDPYGLIWTVADNGGGDWSLNFIYPVDDYYFTDINDWTDFESGSLPPTPPTPPTFQKDIKEIKCRSPYRYIVPDTPSGTYSVYQLQTTDAGYFTFISAFTGEQMYQYVGTSSLAISQDVVSGSIVVGPFGSTITFDSTGTSSFNWDTANFEIKSWFGDIDTPPVDVSYYKDKSKLVASQEKVYINLSNILSERLEGDVVNYCNVTPFTQSQPLGEKESKWGFVDTRFSFIGTTASPYQNDYFYILDGYTEPGEEQGLIRPFTPGWPQRVLMTDWYKRQYTRYSKARIHFKAVDLVSIVATPTGTTASYNISFNSDVTEATNYIQSILVDTSQNMTYSFNYPTNSEVVYTTVFDSDCKYEAFTIIFKNKWGVLESINCIKKSSVTSTFESSDYLKGIVDFNGSYDVTRHTNKQFNTTVMDEIIVNTDYIPEYMNLIIKEMEASNEIWLLNRYNDIKPVIRLDSSITYKTQINDKLIQYTFKFKYSHETINNII